MGVSQQADCGVGEVFAYVLGSIGWADIVNETTGWGRYC